MITVLSFLGGLIVGVLISRRLWRILMRRELVRMVRQLATDTYMIEAQQRQSGRTAIAAETKIIAQTFSRAAMHIAEQED